MKIECVVVATFLTLATAVPELNPVDGVGRVFSKNDGVGNYQFAYNQQIGSGGTFRSESGDPSGAKIGTYGIKDDQGNARVVSYIADKNGFRADIKSTDGVSDPIAAPGQAVSVANAKVVQVAPVKYHVKHSPVFHYHASTGGAPEEGFRISFRKKEKVGEKPVEAVPPGATYYSEDWSEDSSSEGIKDGILRKIPPGAPQYTADWGQHQPQARAIGSSQGWSHDNPNARPQPIGYSTGWPTTADIRNLGGVPVQIVQVQPGSQPGSVQHYASEVSGQQQQSQPQDIRNLGGVPVQVVQVQPGSQPGSVQHYASEVSGQQQSQPQDIRKVDYVHGQKVALYNPSWGVAYNQHPLIKNIPILQPVHYVQGWSSQSQPHKENIEARPDGSSMVMKVPVGIPLVHYVDIKKVDNKGHLLPSFHHHLDKLKDHSLRIGETIEKHLSHYSGGWLTPSRQDKEPSIHKLFKVPVVYSSSLPSVLDSGSWVQSSVNPSWSDAKKLVGKVGALLPYATGWSNLNQGTTSTDKKPSDRSWSSVPAWW